VATRRGLYTLALVAASPIPFLAGLDNVPGWQGFGRGLFVGMLGGAPLQLPKGAYLLAVAAIYQITYFAVLRELPDWRSTGETLCIVSLLVFLPTGIVRMLLERSRRRALASTAPPP
jgi:hypothetical protein